MSPRDTFNFLKGLTPVKTLNVAKVLSSYYGSRLAGRPLNSGYPFTVSVEPTTHCNLRCPQCPSGLRSFTRDTGMIDLSLFEKIAEEMKEYLLYMYLYFQGEPYLHPQFTEMISAAARRGIYTVTSTNAHFLDDEHARNTVESGLSRIIISIDGTSQDSYARYRVGGSLEKVLEGAKNIMNWKQKLRSSTPHTIFQMVIFRHNENEVEELYRLAERCGVDQVQLKSAQIYDFENGSSLIPDNEKYSRYRLQANSFYHIKNPLLNHCWKMWHSCVVTWDGKVVPCCFDKDARHVMGDFQQQSFREIWNGEPYRGFRARLLQSRKEVDICSNCSEGAKVWV